MLSVELWKGHDSCRVGILFGRCIHFGVTHTPVSKPKKLWFCQRYLTEGEQVFVPLSPKSNTRLKHEGHQFKRNLGYIVRHCLQRHTWAGGMAQ